MTDKNLSIEAGKPDTASLGKESEAIIAVVRYMAEQQTADGLTKVWDDPFVWFDTGHCSVEGLESARALYREQFAAIENLRTKILSITAHVDGDVGFAHSVQHFRADGRNGGPNIDFVFRQTDGVVRRAGEWKVVHQHVSLPINFANGMAIFESPAKD